MRHPFSLLTAALAACALAYLPGARPVAAAPSQPLTIFAAGTLAVPFRAVDDAFMTRNPGTQIQAQFGGSVKMVKQITDLHQNADVVAVADFRVIPKYLMPQYADWYAGFVSNGITFVYTPRSKFANEINAGNWYEILSRPGVQIGRANPDTDPSGYATIQMLELAARKYHRPDLADRVLANAPPANMRDTETELIGALESGQIDYLAIYRSDALQHGFKYLNLPADINLSDPAQAATYASVSVKTANGTVRGAPIVYAVTVPRATPNAALAQQYVAFLLGPEGRAIMAHAGFTTFDRGYAVGGAAVPSPVRALAQSWNLPG